MTNPNSAIGTNAAYGGRTSVNAFNDVLAGFTRGILSGWACVPKSGLTISLGGSGTTRDVAVAENNTGDMTSINNLNNGAIDIDIDAAPISNSRIDAIVAYVDNPPQGDDTVADNPGACGLIVVSGTVAASPSAPTENAIRTAITADGASGTTAYYVVLAYVTIAAGTTDIDASMIRQGGVARSKELAFTNNAKFTPTVTGGTMGNINDMYYALNASGTAGKIYGRFRFTATSSTQTVTFSIGALNVPSQFTIAGACYYNTIGTGGYDVINARDMVVRTNGTCTITFNVTVGESVTMWLPACIYFFNDFGDELSS